MLHAAGLSALAAAQPLLDLIARHPGFLVAHRAGRIELAVLVVGLCGALPLAAAGAVGALSWILPRRAAVVQALSTAGWTLLATMPVGKRLLQMPPAGLVAVCLLVAVLAALAYLRWAPARSFCSLLAVGLFVIPALFFSQPAVQRLWRQVVPPDAYFGRVGSQTPIVMIVFDAFPLASLLDEERQIDAVRFPHLAQLAGEAAWFRNATSVHELTGHAVPAILTGNYPQRNKLPTLGDHPYNLFTWLGGEYRLNVYEDLTQLCPTQPVVPDSKMNSLSGGVWRMVRDLSVVLGHVVLPVEWSQRLPGVTSTWNDFVGPSLEEFNLRAGIAHVGRLKRFQEFVDSIDNDPNPALHFLHILLPHDPFAHMPSGRLYVPPNYVHLAGFDEGVRVWSKYDWLVAQAHQRHLLQVKLVDELIGELIQRLRQIGLYERTLLVVTADHGESFWPKEARRDPARTEHPWDIMSVPLLVKLPGETKGVVDDRNVETVDILPTIADALHVALPWSVEGRSALCDDTPPRARKRIESGLWRRLDVADEPEAKFAGLSRQHKLFGVGPIARLFDIGPRKELIGKTVAELTRDSEAAISAELHTDLLTWGQDFQDATVPALVVAQLKDVPAATKRLDLIVAVDDAVTASCPGLDQGDGSWALSVLLPETSLTPGNHRLQLFQVSGSVSQPRVSKIRVTPDILEVRSREKSTSAAE